MRRKVVGTRQLVLLTLVSVGSVVAVVAAAGPATAHNALISTHPADHQQVSRTPAAVVLTFNEPALAMGTHLVITGPSGPVQQGPAQLVDTTVSQALQGGAPAGEYIVALAGHLRRRSSHLRQVRLHRRPARGRRSQHRLTQPGLDGANPNQHVNLALLGGRTDRSGCSRRPYSRWVEARPAWPTRRRHLMSIHAELCWGGPSRRRCRLLPDGGRDRDPEPHPGFASKYRSTIEHVHAPHKEF